MWTQQAWESIDHIYASILEHPFVKLLGDGTLESEKFIFYVQQDWLYLQDYARALAALAAKLPDTEEASQVAKFSIDAQKAETVVHKAYVTQWDPSERMSPTCLLYTSFLAKQVAFGSVETLAAALLPCFWIYEKVGQHIVKYEKPTNPFHTWISMYSSDAFSDSCDVFRKICDKLAAATTPETRKKMTHAFLTSSRLEYMFWDSAWKMDQWPI